MIFSLLVSECLYRVPVFVSKSMLHSNPHTNLILNNLLNPDITKNLISVNQFAKDSDVFFEFHADQCLIKSQVNSETLLQGFLSKGGLYPLAPFTPLLPRVSLQMHLTQSFVTVLDHFSLRQIILQQL